MAMARSERKETGLALLIIAGVAFFIYVVDPPIGRFSKVTRRTYPGYSNSLCPSEKVPPLDFSGNLPVTGPDFVYQLRLGCFVQVTMPWPSWHVQRDDLESHRDGWMAIKCPGDAAPQFNGINGSGTIRTCPDKTYLIQGAGKVRFSRRR
jgi:hypothetical protein